MVRPEPPVPSPKVQLYCVGLPAEALASKATAWPGAGAGGLKVKLAVRPGPPLPAMSTYCRPVAVPQAEFMAVTSCSPAAGQETWIVLLAALPEIVPPEVVQLQ